MSSDVRSYLVGSNSWSSGDDEGDGSVVAMTRKVVRSNRITSVAEHAFANEVRCLESTAAFGTRVRTMLDHAYPRMSITWQRFE